MSNTILIKIAMPSEVVFKANATIVNIPGSDGVFGVLPGHVNLVSTLAIGCISVFSDNEEKKFFIYGGIAQVTHFEINIVSEFAVPLNGQSKSDILSIITDLKKELDNTEKNSLDAVTLNTAINRYSSLLNFIGN